MTEWDRANRPPRTWRAKFSDAFIGVAWGVAGQSSFVVHGAACIAVVLAGFWLGLEPWQWTAVLVVSGLVVCLELINSAIEALAPAVTQKYDPQIDRCLKIASGAVLVASGVAVLVGLIVFLPLLRAKFFG